ncbi:MAG TPA: hypothetical protein PKO07_13740 [Pseudomonadota bacterium]|nr:hypothetical protein [Pseudomonadota bacterium]
MTLAVLGLLLLFLLRAIHFLQVMNKDDQRSEEGQQDLKLSLKLCGWLLFAGSLVYALESLRHGEVYWLILPLLLLSLLWRPMFIVLDVLVPRGLAKWTYRTAMLLLWASADRRGQALLYANLALLRAPSHRDVRDDEAFLLEKQKQLPGGAAALLAAALQVARREGIQSIVPLLRCLDSVDPTVKPNWAMAVAHEILLVDAVRIGDWKKVQTLSLEPFETPLSQFLAACADIFVGLPTKDTTKARDRLYWLWLRAPKKQHLLWLLEQAQKYDPQKPGSAGQMDPVKMTADRPQIEVALMLKAWLLQTDPHQVKAEDLRGLCAVWDLALADQGLDRLIMTRALTLGIAGSEQKAKDTLRSQVVATLRSYLSQGTMPIAKLFPSGKLPPKSVLSDAVLQVRAELLEQFEAQTNKLEERTQDKRSLPWLDEWREWAQIRESYQKIEDFGGMEARRLAWTSLHRQANNWACWLWNARSEKVLANAVFRFLLRESDALGDERTSQLAKKNVGSGL